MMYGSEHRSKLACEQRRRYFAHSLPAGPSKAEMRAALAEAAQNTAALQESSAERARLHEHNRAGEKHD